MSELELEIGRTLGASAFLIYQYIKFNPRATSREIQIETGLSENCVWMTLKELKYANIISYNTRVKTNEYVENKEKDTWKFR